MINVGEAELICDLAETYHIYDYRSLPIKTVGIFAYGLGEDSRIKTKLRGGERVSISQMLAIACDRLSFIAWSKTKSAERGEDIPPSIHEMMYPAEISQGDDALVFDSIEEFEKARKAVFGRKGE